MGFGGMEYAIAPQPEYGIKNLTQNFEPHFCMEKLIGSPLVRIAICSKGDLELLKCESKPKNGIKNFKFFFQCFYEVCAQQRRRKQQQNETVGGAIEQKQQQYRRRGSRSLHEREWGRGRVALS